MLRLALSVLLLTFGATLLAQSAATGSKTEETTLKPTVVESSKAATGTPAVAPKEGGNAAMGDAEGAVVTVCTSGASKRTVEISFGADNKLPCQVHYKKDTEEPGVDRVIYSANSDLQYCYEKAAAHVEKLEGFGWHCSKG
jgi:hypothetical protein